MKADLTELIKIESRCCQRLTDQEVGFSEIIMSGAPGVRHRRLCAATAVLWAQCVEDSFHGNFLNRRMEQGPHTYKSSDIEEMVQ